MSMNILNDISKVYLDQVVESTLLEALGTPKRWWDDNSNGIGYEKGEVSGKFKKRKKKRIKVSEALGTPKRWWDDNSNGIGYEKGEVSGKFKKKKKTRVKKESFSDWRDDLSELMEVIDTKKIEEKPIKGRVDNTNLIKINPTLGEAVEELGGTLLEMVEIENIDCIFDDLSESEVFLLSDKLIEEVVEEFFNEYIQEGYDIKEVENVLIESIDISAALLTEAKVTMGHDTDIKSDRLEKVKSAVKKVGKGLARGVGYVAGAAVRGVRAAGREFSKGYERGRGGSSAGSSSSSPSSSQSSSSQSSSQSSSSQSRYSPSSSQSSSSQSDTEDTGSKRPGLLGRIGSALKSGLKRAVGAGARAVSRGARNVARRMEDGDKTPNSAQTKVRNPLTYRGAGAGTKERLSSGSYTPPTQKKTKPTQGVRVSDPWRGSATVPKPKKAATVATQSKPTTKKSNKLDDLLSNIRNESKIELDEKLNMKKAKMGTVIKDFYKSDAPQFKGMTKEKRRKMAVAAKLTAERGGLKLGEQIVGEDLQPETPQQIAAQNAVLMAQKRLSAANQSSLKKKNKPTQPLETSDPTEK